MNNQACLKDNKIKNETSGIKSFYVILHFFSIKLTENAYFLRYITNQINYGFDKTYNNI